MQESKTSSYYYAIKLLINQSIVYHVHCENNTVKSIFFRVPFISRISQPLQLCENNGS